MPLFVCLFFLFGRFFLWFTVIKALTVLLFIHFYGIVFAFIFFIRSFVFFVCQTKLIRYLNAIYRSMVQRAELFLHNIDWNISHGFLLRIWLFVALSSYWRNVYDEYDPAVISCGCGWSRIASTISKLLGLLFAKLEFIHGILILKIVNSQASSWTNYWC